MARIAFFIEQLPPKANEISIFAYDLIRSLADQHHDIRIFSTYDSSNVLPEPHPRIEILRPFQNWNWLETMRFLPLLLEFRPEILHFIQPYKKMTGLVPKVAKIIGSQPSVLSVFELSNDSEIKMNVSLAQDSTLVSVRNDSQKQLLVKKGVAAGKIHVLPLSQKLFKKYDDPQVGPELRSFLGKYPIFFYLPGPLDAYETNFSFLQILELIFSSSLASASYGVVVGGTLSQVSMKERELISATLQKKAWGSRLFFTGEPSASLEYELLKTARGVLTGGLKSDSLSFLRLLRAALQAAAALVLSQQQTNLDPLPWKHGQNAWICRSATDLQEAIQILIETETTHQTLRLGASELGYRQASDDPGNLLSRLYADMLNLGVCRG